MHKVYKAQNFKKPPKYNHSVFGVGKYKSQNNSIVNIDDDEIILENGLKMKNKN